MPFVCAQQPCDAAKHEAKGLCKRHYTASRPRYPDKLIETNCDQCGASILKGAQRRNRYTTLFCSPECQVQHRWGALQASKKTVVLYRPRPLWHTAHRTIAQPEIRPRFFTAGSCAICAKAFLCLYGSRTCSAACQQQHDRDINREAKHRRRARQREAFVAPVNRRAIYQRDQWVCQLCGVAMDMDALVPSRLAPTIDHIVPLAKGGTHEPRNVQAAHFICNSIKSDRVA